MSVINRDIINQSNPSSLESASVLDINQEPLTNTKKLNCNWTLWYHDPNDIKWNIESYKIVSNVKTISDFWNTYEFIENTVIENSMFFIMRDGIQPLWEDPSNVDGGCWSFKISKGNIRKYWSELSIYLLGENITNNKSNLVNGLSISPKKTFCIIKIWNNDKTKNDIGLLNNKMDIPFESCIYKQHK